jgi:hypothetical protein
VAKRDEKQIRDVLGQIARTASVMFDGESCHQIVTERSWKWMRDFDPSDRWSPHDNYDVEHAPFIAAKKTLLRLQMLAPEDLPVQCILWQPVPTLEGKWTVAIWNGGPSRWWTWGGLHVDPAPEIVKAFQSGEPQDVDPGDGEVLSVVTPVRDSLKEIVGVIEVSASRGEPIINW